MGQRLVIDIVQDNEPVAAIYYHWSAYYASTIGELAKLSKAILKAEREGKDPLLGIIEELETVEYHITPIRGEREPRRGGISSDDLELARTLFPNHTFETEYVDRNCGIIALSKKRMADFHDWEEGWAQINIDTHEIDDNVDLDPYPFEFVDAEYEEDEYGEQGISYLHSGRCKINGIESNIDPFECTCETIIELNDFMHEGLEKWTSEQSKISNG